MFSIGPIAVGLPTIRRTASVLLLAAWFLLSQTRASANVPGGGTGTGANVTVTDNGGTVVLANGVVSFTLNKSNGNVTNFTYNGTNLLAGGHGGGYFYFDGSGGPTLTNPVYTLSVNPANNGGNQAEVWLQSTADPMDMAVYYDLLRGQQGIYDTMILTHQAGYADYPGGELRTNMYVGSLFDWLCVDPYRFRQMADPNSTNVAVPGAPAEVWQWTGGIYSGSTECKYAYSAPLGKVDAYGWASSSSPYGVWQTFPSHEFLDGGPMHRELTEHIGNTLLDMFGGGHYGFGSNGDQPAGTFSTKTFGPAFIYANKYAGPAGDPVSLKARVLWADAQAQAAAEQGAWPYTWFNPQPVGGSGSAYPQASGRGTVGGTLAISDPSDPGSSPVSLWIGLAPVDGGVDFQQQYLTYQYWVRTGAGGSFSIPHVTPGAYNLWAFGPGVVGTYEKTNVTVAAGQSLNLGTVTWTPLRLGPTVWDIGIPDRDSNEFNNGEHDVTPYSGVLPPYAGGAPHNTPTDWAAFLAYPNEYPAGVSYAVGTSRYANDWNYCQPDIPNGSGGFVGSTSKIFFNLASAPTAAQTARLYIAFASVYSSACILTINGTVQTASVMGSTNGNYTAITNPATGFYPPNLSFDSIVRLGSQGTWGDAYLDFAGTKLKAGMNEIDISLRPTGGAGNGNGFEYDYLRLEMTGYSSGSATPSATPSATAPTAPTSTPTPTVTASPTRTLTPTASTTSTGTASFTSTPTPTATFSPTRTATPTLTASRTFTPTATPSRTNTATFTTTPTATPTATLTATRSNTPSATATFSSTPTSTRTFTATSTASFTATRTPTPTPTPSFTPTRTFTPTASPTPTLTASFTTTPSMTPTRSFTFTATPTASATATSTATRTSTFTPTPSATWTFTQTPTDSATASATASPSPSATASQTPTNSLTPTGTASGTPTPTRTLTLTLTSTPTPSASFTATSSATPSMTTSMTRTPTYTNTPSWTASPTPTVTSSWTPTQTLTSTPLPTSTLSATPSMTRTFTPTATSSSTPTSTATSSETPPLSPTATPSASPSATTTDSFTATHTPIPPATATPTSTQTETPTSTTSSTPTWTATPSFTATTPATATPGKTSTPTSTVTPSASATASPTRTLTPTVSTTSTGTATWTATPSFTPTPSSSFTPSETWTPTIVPTPVPTGTWTDTTTASATPPPLCPPVSLSVAYPNPVTSGFVPVQVDLTSPCPKTVQWAIVTTAYRRVAGGTVQVAGKATVAWNQRDLRGRLVANGTYEFLLAETGQPVLRTPILILR